MQDDHKRHEGQRHTGASHSSPYPVSRLAPPHDLVDIARQIERADHLLSTVAGSKLQVIADQIQALQGEARRILEKTQRDAELHRATCNFQKRPGQVYHLYARAEDQLYVSMLSPDDWAGDPPHTYRGSYRLEADMSWTPADEVAKAVDPQTWLRKLLDAPLTPDE